MDRKISRRPFLNNFHHFRSWSAKLISNVENVGLIKGLNTVEDPALLDRRGTKLYGESVKQNYIGRETGVEQVPSCQVLV